MPSHADSLQPPHSRPLGEKVPVCQARTQLADSKLNAIPDTQLAAWTVARQADGSIKVTIRELRDPAGLQQRLRADGVPASVTFSGQQNPACRGYPGGGSQSQRRQRLSSVVTAPATGRDVMLIHPAALSVSFSGLLSPAHRAPEDLLGHDQGVCRGRSAKIYLARAESLVRDMQPGSQFAGVISADALVS